jgi:molybdopterin converting factor small subunit
MKVSFQYFAQVRKAAGIDSEDLEVAPDADLAAALTAAAEKHGDAFRAVVLDEEGKPQPSVILLVNGQAARRDDPPQIRDGDSISLLSAVAGG